MGVAAIQDLTTEYIELLLVTNPPNVGGVKASNQTFPLTLRIGAVKTFNGTNDQFQYIGGLLTTPITRQQLLNELLNRVAAEKQNSQTWNDKIVLNPCSTYSAATQLIPPPTGVTVGAIPPQTPPQVNPSDSTLGNAAVEPVQNQVNII